MICPKCKKEIPDESKYCLHCGKNLTAPHRTRHKRLNGTGGISKLPGKRAKPYVARYNGMFVGTYETKTEADTALANATIAAVSDRFNMTFAECYKEWVPEHKALLKSRNIANGHETGETSGMKGYEFSYAKCEALYEKRLRSIRTSDMQHIIDTMREDGCSASTCNKVKQLFSQIFKWGIKERIVQNNLAEYVTVLPDSVERKRENEKSVFTKEDILKLQASSLPAAKITLVLLASGARISELFQAKTVDCTDDYFVGGVKSKSGRNRIIPISQLGIEEYRSILNSARQKGCNLLIEGIAGNNDAKNWRKRDYYPMLDKLGIQKKVPHETRHTFITAAVDSGVAPETLKEIVGHASYSTTIDKYDHRKDEELLKTVKRISF